MKKPIKLLLYVAIGSAAVKLGKVLFHAHDEDRPPIRVRSGGSIHVDTDRGDFVRDGLEWRQRAPGTKGPKTLDVTVSHAGEVTTYAGRFVLIVYRIGGMERELMIAARKRYIGLFKDHVYVEPDQSAVVNGLGSTLVLEPGQETRLLRVSVSANQNSPVLGSVTFEDGDIPEIDIFPRS